MMVRFITSSPSIKIIEKWLTEKTCIDRIGLEHSPRKQDKTLKRNLTM